MALCIRRQKTEAFGVHADNTTRTSVHSLRCPGCSFFCGGLSKSMKRCHQLCLAVGIKLMIIMRVLAFQPASRSWKAISRGPRSQICGSTLQTFVRNFPARRTTTTTVFSSTEATRTLAPGSHTSELEVKKSRFLGYAKHAENWDEALAYIQEVKAEHPKGRHWCHGFQCGVNPVSERCSDDGEPTGTAGLPILGTSMHWWTECV
jgi:hypothetical protein